MSYDNHSLDNDITLDMEETYENIRVAFLFKYNPENGGDLSIYSDEEQIRIRELAQAVVDITRTWVNPKVDCLTRQILSERVANYAAKGTPGSSSSHKKERPSLQAPTTNVVPSVIPETTKELHAHSVWLKARAHGLIPRESVYTQMCPSEESKRKFYNDYVLKIIEIDEGAQASFLKHAKAKRLAAKTTTKPAPKALNPMQTFQVEYRKANPNATLVEIGLAWEQFRERKQQQQQA